MELGVSSLLWYHEDDLVPHLSLLARNGIRFLELRRVPPHLCWDDPAQVRRLGRALRECGVTARTLHVPDALIAQMSLPVEATRVAAVEQAGRIARAFADVDGRILVTHAGGVVESETDRAAQFAAGRISVAELARRCRDLGLQVAVENALPTQPRVADTVTAAARFADGIDAGNVGLCLDTSHANIGEDPVAAVEIAGKRLLTLHISDNDGARDEHALPFEGTVDWPAFMAALRAVGYDDVFTLEVRGTRPPEEMLPDAVARFERLMAF